MAKDLDIPVVALAQLSRDADNDGKNGIPPDKKHFKESGDIEQDGDLMLTLYRPEYYKLPEFNGQSSANLLVTAVIKNRDGALGQILNHFNPAEGIIKNLHHNTNTPF
jgi:replicative DNA helicase